MELFSGATDLYKDFDQNVLGGQDNLVMVPASLNNLLQCQMYSHHIPAKKYYALPSLLLMRIRHVHVILYSVHSKERLKETEGTDLVRYSL